MLSLSDRPPVQTSGPALQITRTPQGRPFTGLILSNNLTGTNTHFYKGRTCPCELPNCAACADGLPWRWHGYVACMDITTGRHCLYELTAAAAEPLVTYHDLTGTLRGVLFESTRIGKRPNGRVTIRCKPSDPLKHHLPPEPNVPLALCQLWNLPFTALEPDGLQKGAPRIAVNSNIVDDLSRALLPTERDGNHRP